MSRLDKLSFTPIRLDWTKSRVRRQVFYEGGHHIGEIPVNSDGTFDKECETYKIVKELIDEVYTPTPKLVTWGDIKRFKKISLNRFQLDYQASSYLNFIHDYHSTGTSMNLQETKTDEMVKLPNEERHKGSGFYHGCKGHWLLHDIKENGLNQPIQGVIQRNAGNPDEYDIHIHPGSVRQGVFGMTDDDNNTLVVWDAYDAFDWIEPLEMDEWLSVFAKPQFDNQMPTSINVVYSYTNIELQVSGAWVEKKKEAELSWRKKVREFSKRISEMMNGKPLNIYIGYDSRHQGIEDVQIKSLKQAMKKAVREDDMRFEPEIKLLDKAKISEYNREYANQSTEFTYSRFLIPYLENYEGFSIFVDNDFIWKQPFWEMFYFLHPDNAVACVQYEHELEKMSTTKMGGEKNVIYPKKLWSSFMIFNNAHEDCKKLTPEVINTASGQYLHQFEWTDKIDRIPDKYILTEGMSNYDKRYHAVHYTRGGPWIDGMDTSEIEHLELYNKIKDSK